MNNYTLRTPAKVKRFCCTFVLFKAFSHDFHEIIHMRLAIDGLVWLSIDQCDKLRSDFDKEMLDSRKLNEHDNSGSNFRRNCFCSIYTRRVLN